VLGKLLHFFTTKKRAPIYIWCYLSPCGTEETRFLFKCDSAKQLYKRLQTHIKKHGYGDRITCDLVMMLDNGERLPLAAPLARVVIETNIDCQPPVINYTQFIELFFAEVQARWADELAVSSFEEVCNTLV
jgi:hypothetical protein